jgi:porin
MFSACSNLLRITNSTNRQEDPSSFSDGAVPPSSVHGGKCIAPRSAPKYSLALAMAIGLAALSVTPAMADGFEAWINQPTMTGNWGGVRTSLANDGIVFKSVYLGQFGANVSGGKRTGSDYTQQISFGADWDLQKLFGLQGAKLFTYVEDRVGRGLSGDYVGGVLQQDGFFGSGENFRLSELAYEQDFLNKRIDILAGYYVLSTQFAYTPLLCNSNFLGNAFCGHPQYLTADSSGYQLGPVASWGGRVSFLIRKNLYLEIGASETNPVLTQNNKGFDLNFKGATGAIIPVEIGLTEKLGPQALVGHYKVGGFYDTSQAPDEEFTHVTRTGRYSGYILIDQQVYEIANNPNRAITVFGEAGIADKRTALEDSYLAAGFVVQGPFASRPYDNINFGWVHASINPRLLKAHAATQHILDSDLEEAETNFELDYNIQLTRWLAITPDFQYVVNPGASNFAHFHNAVVVGGQFKAFL